MIGQWLEIAQTRPAEPVVKWPDRFIIQRPLIHDWPWTFNPPLKMVRRLVKRFSPNARTGSQ
jgi:hypothetical protein